MSAVKPIRSIIVHPRFRTSQKFCRLLQARYLDYSPPIVVAAVKVLEESATSDMQVTFARAA